MSRKKKQNQNQQQTLKKASPKILGYSFSKDVSKDVPKEPSINTTLRHEWIPFGINNLFPQELAELSRSASTHRAILSTKVTFSIGEGLRTAQEDLSKYLEDVNAFGESMDDVARKVMSDYWKFGNAYIEVVTGNGYCNFYHQDATTARVEKGGKNILLHPDWEHAVRYPDEMRKIPIYPSFKKDEKIYRTIIHLTDYESTYFYYGMPDY